MTSAYGRVEDRAKEPRYSVLEAASFIGQPPSTIRRWALGNPRNYHGTRRLDEPLIAVDGDLHSDWPISFLNLLELRFLAAYRKQVPLQAIRSALDYAADQLGEPRPLLTVKFKVYGRELFMNFAEGDPQLVNASRSGQLVWPEAVEGLFESIEYDPSDDVAVRWWPLGTDVPVVIDTRINAGQPSTARSAVRTIAIASRRREGYDVASISADVTASSDEVEAALQFEGVALAA
jgi:hypothetical protein